jgi:hypothetical protein
VNSSKEVARLRCIPNRSQKISGEEKTLTPHATRHSNKTSIHCIKEERLARMDPVSQLQEIILEQSVQIQQLFSLVKQMSKRLDEL